MIGHNCITDRETKEMWRDYRRVVKDGNPLGLSFAEYVAQRVIAAGTRFVYASETNPTQTPWYVSACGHQHPWGESCGSWTST